MPQYIKRGKIALNSLNLGIQSLGKENVSNEPPDHR